ncbi:type 1 glutamine amidotransferase [Sulfitobacter sp. LCG007]
MTPQIAILDLTTSYTGMRPGEAAGELIRNWLRPAMPEAALHRIDVAGGAAIPAPGAFDGFVLSGSEIGVYDDRDWLASLRSFLLAARQAGKPLVGICFGHQLMADCFGGRAENAGKGVILGMRPFTVDGMRRETWVWHQDQVTHVPPGARITAAADYCPVGALEYPFAAYSVQFHPEFTEDYLRREIANWAGTALTAEVAAAGLASLHGAEVARDLVAARAAEVLCRR